MLNNKETLALKSLSSLISTSIQNRCSIYVCKWFAWPLFTWHLHLSPAHLIRECWVTIDQAHTTACRPITEQARSWRCLLETAWNNCYFFYLVHQFLCHYLTIGIMFHTSTAFMYPVNINEDRYKAVFPLHYW